MKRRKGLSETAVRYSTPAHVAYLVDFPAAQEAAARGDCDRAIVDFGAGAINLGKSRSGPVQGETVENWKAEKERAEEAYRATLKVMNKACRCQARR
jgi:hypothetical protein